MALFPTIDASLTTPATAVAFESAFFGIYEPELPNVQKRLEGVMELGLTSKAADSTYHYYETAPHPRIWKRGEEISQDGFRGRSWTVLNYHYARELVWYDEDEKDDQTGQLLPKAEQLGQHFALLDERLFFQVLTAATDADLLPAIPVSPDGAAMFSATDGDGNARFGVTGGNIITGQGTATTEAIEDDFYRMSSRMKQFQDKKGQPRVAEESLQDWVAIIPVTLERVFERTFFPDFVQGANAAISGVSSIRKRPRIFATQRLTGSDYYWFNTNIRNKAIFKQTREPLQSNIGDFGNSDRTRSTRIKSLQFSERLGIGLAVPYQCIKVDN